MKIRKLVSETVVLISVVLSFTTLTGESWSKDQPIAESYYTVYIKSSQNPTAEALVTTLSKLTTIINRNIGGFACELDSRMASIYAKQRPDDVAMVIVSINSNCESMERELVNGWLRDPIFTVLPGISFPSISGSN